MNQKREYAWGLVFFCLGLAGIAEHVTSGAGSFPICAVIAGIGFVLMCWSYVR